MPIIQAEKLCKRYGRHEVLQNIDLAIEPGRLVGFLGPNGAGKTTTIRVLLGVVESHLRQRENQRAGLLLAWRCDSQTSRIPAWRCPLLFESHWSAIP